MVLNPDGVGSVLGCYCLLVIAMSCRDLLGFALDGVVWCDDGVYWILLMFGFRLLASF